MQCSSCQHANGDAARFCEACGALLARSCPACGQEATPQARFCSACGLPLAGVVDRHADVSRAEEPASGERRQLTVLFCDLVGSTERSAHLDPEEWREIVGRYQRAASEVVVRFDGHVAQILGDGLLAYFGWPRAHDDDAERAVRTGLALVDAVQGAPDGLSVRVGIHTGPVVVGLLGAGERAETLAVGEVPNVAARVQALAGPDSVLVTSATHRLVAGLFVAEEAGDRALKGISEPVTLFRVNGTTGVRGRLRAAAARGLTPFVGRAEERRLLRSRWERTQEGDGQVVLVAGEAGIGKSRLVEVLREDLAEVPHTWLECACSPYHSNTPFFPVIDMLQRGLAWGGDEKPGERVASLERALVLAGLEPARALPLVAPLLGLPVPEGYPPLLLAPEAQRKRLLATLVAWVVGGARVQPMVIATEDVHWADPSTLELQGLLVEQGATVPLLLVFTARPEYRAPWPMRAHHAQLTLSRLPRREVREMVERVIERAALAPEVIEGVVARTDGVPLFVEELTRLVLEGGGRGVGREIPVTLQDSLMARLDRLGPAKEVAQIASAIGRGFSWALLRAVAPLRDAELEAALVRLADAELVYARGLPPDATYLLQARSRPGRGLRVAAQEPPAGSPPRHRACARREVPRRRRGAPGGTRAPLDGGGRGDLCRGRVADGGRALRGALGARRGHRALPARHRGAGRAPRLVRARTAGAPAPGGARAGALRREGLRIAGGRRGLRPRARAGRADGRRRAGRARARRPVGERLHPR
jgi:class 3 adenylate cyclase